MLLQGVLHQYVFPTSLIVQQFMGGSHIHQSYWNDVARELCWKISGQFMDEQLRIFSGGLPHPVGSAQNESLGEKIASDWKSWGIPKVVVQEFFSSIPLAPSPTGPWNEVLLQLVDGQVVHRCKNYAKILNDAERTGVDQLMCGTADFTLLPVYQAYSASGSKVGRFVFANYARPADLVLFDRIQGRKTGEPSLFCSSDLIVVCRLGFHSKQSSIRALLNHCNCGDNGTPLPDHHPAALVFYPDPHDWTPADSAIYPNGASLPGDAPLFGHVCMSHFGGGNPNLPDLPSSVHVYEENAMIPGGALTSLLVQPIGYDDAKIILSHLSGPPLPLEWKGCLANAVGPSPDYQLTVTVHNRISDRRIRCANVLGIIPGDLLTDESDEYVILGNHRDAWVQGACDPGSGTAILQQIAKILGTSYTEGFRPRRTIVLASWDGEEISLFGSTHAALLMNQELGHRTLAYINADCPVKGHCQFNARTDPLLANVLLTACRTVQVDPPANTSSWMEEWLATEGKASENQLIISTPGIGSDHIPFAYKLGIPSSYPEFRPDNGLFYMPVYHTEYDRVDVAERFTDPPSVITGLLPRHRLMARLVLTMMIQLSCSPRLPYDLKRWAGLISRKWQSFMKYAISKVPCLVNYGVYLEWLAEDVLAFTEAVTTFENLLESYERNSHCSFPPLLNRILVVLPKLFVRPSPNRSGPFPHVLYHPTGYRYTFFPHVRSALDEFADHLKDTVDPNPHLQKLKRELSILTTCFQQATSWLQNGLVGLDLLTQST